MYNIVQHLFVSNHAELYSTLKDRPLTLFPMVAPRTDSLRSPAAAIAVPHRWPTPRRP